ncbi:RHS repeat domain-containing protein [Variovorax sp. Varisp85]|uniref:RHS repeat domain-containing protein n=1 Tax=Variovorax sp. Varisp85 TaxID=3243059 RepID=UPI0039A53F37
MHYIHEPGSFVPLVQIRQAQAVALSQTTDVKALIAANGGSYDIEQDPLWNGEQLNTPAPFAKEEIAFYQCDHLGTPQELTDHEGRIAWSASYKAWGEARQAISEAGRKAGFRNPIRFQGQYFDDETGLHYNRYRYYDPVSGRFVSKDPIKLLGGLNLQLYAPSPTEWIDPWGLASCSLYRSMKTGADGLPLPEPTARGLGARIPGDLSADEHGNVHPNTGGISVAPHTPGNLPSHRRPASLGGTGKDEVWGINSENLGPDLRYVQDCPTHGTIQPSRTMPAGEYQAALERTKTRWRKP